MSLNRVRFVSLPAFIILLGIFSFAPSVTDGFFLDDYLNQAVLNGHYPELTWWNFTDYSTIQERIFPWWTYPGVKHLFLRPMVNATIAFDHLLYGSEPAGYHISSLIWFSIFLILSFLLYRNLTGSLSTATWALAFLAIHPLNLIPVSWIANRNSVLFGVFAVCTLLMLDLYRKHSLKKFLIASYLCYVAAILSKESGVIAFGPILLYSLLLDPACSMLPLRRRFLSILTARWLWGFLLIGCLFLANYTLAGYGTNLALYLNPLSEPGTFLIKAIREFPLLLLKQFDFLPFSKVDLSFKIETICAAIFAVLALVVVWKDRSLALFFAGWMIFCTLGEVTYARRSGGPYGFRNLIPANAGACFLLGSLAANLWHVIRKDPKFRVPALLVLIFILSLGICGATIKNFVDVRSNSILVQKTRDAVITAEIGSGKELQTVFFLNCPVGSLELFSSDLWRLERELDFPKFEPLYCGTEAIQIHRTSDRSFTLHASGGIIDSAVGKGFLIRGRKIIAGLVWEGPNFNVTAREMEQNKLISADFVFRDSLESQKLQFVSWEAQRFKPIKLPPAGKSIVISEVSTANWWGISPNKK